MAVDLFNSKFAKDLADGKLPVLDMSLENYTIAKMAVAILVILIIAILLNAVVLKKIGRI